MTPNLPSDNPFVCYKRVVESAVRSSGLTWTILQPGAFMETQAGPFAGWDLHKGKARILGSGRVPISHIAIADVAAFAIASIDHPKGGNRMLHLNGPEPLTGSDAVAIAERVTGQTFKVQRMPIAALKVLRVLLKPLIPPSRHS